MTVVGLILVLFKLCIVSLFFALAGRQNALK